MVLTPACTCGAVLVVIGTLVWKVLTTFDWLDVREVDHVNNSKTYKDVSQMQAMMKASMLVRAS